MTRVAFLGLGDIGGRMARRIAAASKETAGIELAAWNRSAARAKQFEGTIPAGAKVRMAASAADAVRGANVVVSCLPTSGDVSNLLDSIRAAAQGGPTVLSSGAVWLDCTSGDPPTSRQIAADLAKHGVAYIDAPVSGGTSGADAGTLTVMCGGDPAVLDRVRPILATFAGKVVHCGAVGTGMAVKAVNNALLAVDLWSTAEGLAALRKAGVAPGVALDVINASSGRSNASMNLIPQRVLTREFPRTFRLALLDKDVGIAAAFLREEKVPSVVIQQVAELMRLAHNELGDAADHVEAVKVIERWAGVEIK